MTSASFSRPEVEVQLTRARADAQTAGISFASAVLDRLTSQESLSVALETAVQQAEDWLRILRSLQTEIQSIISKTTVSIDTQATWFSEFARALLAWQLDTCRQMLNSLMDEYKSVVATGLKSLNTNNYADALPMLALVLEHAELDAEQQARLQVFIGRIHLFHRNAPSEAKTVFDQAQSLAPELGLVKVAQGDYERSLSHFEVAAELYEQALDKARNDADMAEGAIGLGLADEGLKHWSDANRNYDFAIEKLRNEPDLIKALSKLAAPVSGNLYLQAARALRTAGQEEEALIALDLAMAQGIKDDTDYPERIGYRLKGELLDKLERPAEASDAYRQAAEQFSWVEQFDIALELYNLALKAKPDSAPALWGQADVYWRQCLLLPKPPYVDRDLLQKSEEAWKQGMSLATPDADRAWVYALWACLRESRARLDVMQRTELLWEGVVYGERAVATAPSISYNLGALARCYRALYQELNALYLFSKTADLYPENQRYWIGDLIVSLVNYGYFKQALEQLDRLESLEHPDPSQKPSEIVWCKAIRAFILVRMDQAETALQLITEALASPDYDSKLWVWFDIVKIDCHRTLGEYQRARQGYQELFDNRGDPNDETNRYRDSSATIAWAAYSTDHLAEAFEYATRAIERVEENPCYVNLQLAQYYLVPGEMQNLAKAQDLFAGAVEKLGNLRILRDILDLDLNDTLRFARENNWPNQSEVVKIVEEMQTKVKNRLDVLEAEPADPSDELIRMDANSVTLIQAFGVTLGCARLVMDYEQWREAIAGYDMLVSASETFPEISRLGLLPEIVAQRDKALDKLREQIDTLLGEGDYDTAVETLKLLLNYRSDNSDWQMNLHTRLEVVQRMQQGDYEEAFRLTLESLLEQGHDAGQQMGESLVALKPRMSVFWPWRNAVTNSIGSDPKHRQEWTSIQQALDCYLDSYCQLDRVFDIKIDEFFRISIELDEGLIPERTGTDEWALLAYVRTLREQHILPEMGVRIPSINFRDRRSDTRDGYMILLDEIPEESGRVELDKSFCPASAETLKSYDVDVSNCIAALNPLTGETGYWVPPTGWDNVLAHGGELWIEPLVYLVNHLEAVLRRHLAKFVGLHELEYDILPVWRTKLTDPVLIDRLLPNQAAKLRLVWLLRELAAERVPLVDGPAILEAVNQTGLADLEQVLHAVRLRLVMSQEECLSGSS